MVLGKDIGNGPACVEILGPPIEELFEHVQKLGILLRLDPGIFDDEAAIGMQSFGNFLAILHVVSCFGEEGLNVDDGDRKGGAKEPADFEYFKHAIDLL